VSRRVTRCCGDRLSLGPRLGALGQARPGLRRRQVHVLLLLAAITATCASPRPSAAAVSPCFGAQALVELGLLAQAERAYELLEKAPGTAVCAPRGLIRIEVRRKRAAKAVEAGKTSEAQGDFGDAVRNYATALRLDTSLSEARSRLAALTLTQQASEESALDRATAWADHLLNQVLQVIKLLAYVVAALALAALVLLWIPSVKRHVRKSLWRPKHHRHANRFFALSRRFLGWFVATPIHVLDFTAHDDKAPPPNDLQALLVSELPRVASPRHSGVDVVMAPLSAGTTASQIIDALQKVTQLTHIAAFLSFLRLVLPRDELQLVGYLQTEDRGLSLSLTMGTARGDAVGSVTLSDFEFCSPESAAGVGRDVQLRTLAIVGATWTIYEMLKRRGLTEDDLTSALGTASWKSFGLSRLGAELREAWPDAARWATAQARDLDPGNIPAHFNLAVIELHRAITDAEWHLRYVRRMLTERRSSDRESFDALWYQWAYNWYALQLNRALARASSLKETTYTVKQEDVTGYASHVSNLLNALDPLEERSRPLSMRQFERRELLSDLEMPSLVLLAELLAGSITEASRRPRRYIPFAKPGEWCPDRAHIDRLIRQIHYQSQRYVAEMIISYVQSKALTSRALYNLACYHAGQPGPHEDTKQAENQALRLLRESFEGSPWLAKWAREDPSLMRLRRERKRAFNKIIKPHTESPKPHHAETPID
jgi:hypothetical protein